MTKRAPKMKTLPPPQPTAPAAAGEPSIKARAKRSPLIERLVAWRKKNDLTQKETAARLEISYETYKAYECGHRNPNGPTTLKMLGLLDELK